MKEDKWTITFELTTPHIAQWNQNEVHSCTEFGLQKYFGTLPLEIKEIKHEIKEV